MTSKRAYKRVDVKQIDRTELLDEATKRSNPLVSVGLDIGKREIVAVLRWPDGKHQRPWSVHNPSEICVLIEILQLLREHCQRVSVGLESTGTYGESVRYALTNNGFTVHRIEGKASSDYKEIFDGVPSQHDGKDAAIIAELTAFGKGTPWNYEAPDPTVQAMKIQCRRYITFLDEKGRWTNRLEACLARHWPELTEILDLTSATLVKMLAHYGSPATLAADANASANIRRWSGPLLSQHKIDLVVDSAFNTGGLPMLDVTRDYVIELATFANTYRLEIADISKQLQHLAQGHEGMSPFIQAFGAPSLCSLWATTGDPLLYASSRAYLKALGLNLKERSSGKHKGQLKITKRGPGLGRRALYYWAMRSVQRRELKSWYQQYSRVGKNTNSASKEHRKQKALICLCRKGASGLWYARNHNKPFDFAKIFPGRPLDAPRRRTDRRRRR